MLILVLVLFRPQQRISVEMPSEGSSARAGQVKAVPDTVVSGDLSMNETVRAILQRRSVRNFLPDMPDDAVVRAIVEAGRSAPSAYNRQARLFVVIRNRELLAEMNDAVKEVAAKQEDEFMRRVGNDPKYDVFYRTPVLVVVTGDASVPMIEQDCSAANENMLIAAEALGLGGCWINFTRLAFDGPRSEEFRRKLNIPEGYQFYCSAAIGRKAVERSDSKTIQGNEVRFLD